MKEAWASEDEDYVRLCHQDQGEPKLDFPAIICVSVGVCSLRVGSTESVESPMLSPTDWGEFPG